MEHAINHYLVCQEYFLHGCFMFLFIKLVKSQLIIQKQPKKHRKANYIYGCASLADVA